MTFNRPLTPAEQEHLRSLSVLVREYAGDKIRLSPDQRLFVESHDSSSRDIYEAVAEVVASSFVNVFPIAVRTFRELVDPPLPPQTHALMTTVSNAYETFRAPAEVPELVGLSPERLKKKKKKKGKAHAN